MGIDARAFVRLKGRENWLKPEDELHAAYELASTIGHETFWINDEHHALSIVEPWAEDYCPDLLGKIAITQDGEPIIAEPDEQFVQVYMFMRYYGPGYARGDWKALRSIFEWLQLRFPTGEVWYGGDSSGVLHEHMTPEKIAEFNRFFLESGRRTYTSTFGMFSREAPCNCPRCKERMMNIGGGGNRTFFQCDGCGRKLIRTPSEVFEVPRGKDFFEVELTP